MDKLDDLIRDARAFVVYHELRNWLWNATDVDEYFYIKEYSRQILYAKSLVAKLEEAMPFLYSDEVEPVVENSNNEWRVEIRKPNTQCPYFEAEDSCFVLSDSEGESVACEKALCPLIYLGGGK